MDSKPAVVAFGLQPRSRGPQELAPRNPQTGNLRRKRSLGVPSPSRCLAGVNSEASSLQLVDHNSQSFSSEVARNNNHDIVKVRVDPASARKSLEARVDAAEGASQTDGKQGRRQGTPLVNAHSGFHWQTNAVPIPPKMGSRQGEPGNGHLG